MKPDLTIIAGAGPDEGPAPATPGPSAMDYVPLGALQLPDEQEQMQSPAKGDKVQYTVEGTIESIDGDQACIKREAINGQPVTAPSNAPETPPDNEAGEEAGMADLRKQAEETQL